MILAIELFNRPWADGRTHSVLILLDHSFEMLLKAGILNRGGKIRQRNRKETIGFDACLRKALSDNSIKFLKEDEVLALQALNGLRDAAQHHLLDISENQFYVHVQSGVTLYRQLLSRVFTEEIADKLPKRVFPVSLSIPADIETFFDKEIEEIRKLLSPKKRRRVEAKARLKSLVILDEALKGAKVQPSDSDLDKMLKQIACESDWAKLFEGVASVRIEVDGVGPTIALRFSKKEGIPVTVVPKGTPGASVVGVKRVNELDYYSLNFSDLKSELGLNSFHLHALIWYSRIQQCQECYKLFKIGKQEVTRYSPKALDRMKKCLSQTEIQTVLDEFKRYRRKTSSSARIFAMVSMDKINNSSETLVRNVSGTTV